MICKAFAASYVWSQVFTGICLAHKLLAATVYSDLLAQGMIDYLAKDVNSLIKSLATGTTLLGFSARLCGYLAKDVNSLRFGRALIMLQRLLSL